MSQYQDKSPCKPFSIPSFNSKNECLKFAEWKVNAPLRENDSPRPPKRYIQHDEVVLCTPTLTPQQQHTVIDVSKSDLPCYSTSSSSPTATSLAITNDWIHEIPEGILHCVVVMVSVWCVIFRSSSQSSDQLCSLDISNNNTSTSCFICGPIGVQLLGVYMGWKSTKYSSHFWKGRTILCLVFASVCVTSLQWVLNYSYYYSSGSQSSEMSYIQSKCAVTLAMMNMTMYIVYYSLVFCNVSNHDVKHEQESNVGVQLATTDNTNTKSRPKYVVWYIWIMCTLLVISTVFAILHAFIQFGRTLLLVWCIVTSIMAFGMLRPPVTLHVVSNTT